MSTVEVRVPDIGDFDSVEVIEVLVSPGDHINVDDSLVTLESDKAAMEIPSSHSGIVESVKIKVGDKVSEGSLILMLEEKAAANDAAQAKQSEPAPAPVAEAKPQAAPAPMPAPAPAPAAAEAPKPSPTAHIDVKRFKNAHASPGVRKFARELGVDLGKVSGSGPKNRILKEDVQSFVKQALTSAGSGGGSLGVEPMPDVDFSQWGEVDIKPLTKINKLTGKFLHRNWVTIPHVTQFDEADITELEAFRKQSNEEYAKQGVKFTLLSFIMKALVVAMKKYPRFNSSLDASGENLIMKNYYHVGIAVDTPDGLVVPVVRDVDKKSIVDISIELKELSQKARDKKLTPSDMQGGCMSISSLGGIGGTKFTPIVNAPEVAILGVSKAEIKPQWNGKEFEPRLMCPLSLSYDHRVIDGADGARFAAYVSLLLSDARRILL